MISLAAHVVISQLLVCFLFLMSKYFIYRDMTSSLIAGYNKSVSKKIDFPNLRNSKNLVENEQLLRMSGQMMKKS